MSLHWFRVECNIAMHDKTLHLLSDESEAKFQAAFSHVCAVGWSVATGNNGRIPQAALPFVHGTQETADLLVKYGLWKRRTAAWEIHNFLMYQQASEVTEAKRKAQSFGGKAARCKANHGPDCGCNYMSEPSPGGK